MPNFKPIDDRQVINRAALPNIGSPANDSLDDIFSRIDSIIAGLTSGSSYIAKKVSLTNASTSLVVTLPAQPDTSYIVLGMMGNTTDAFPEYQQVQITSKTTTGFTFTWNSPLDSGNYFLCYIVPPKVFPEVEASIGSSANTLASTLLAPQPANNYGVIAELQNITDAHPQFQSVVVGSNTTTATNFNWNVITDSSNYLMAYGILSTGQATISNASSSVTINLPVNFNTSSYAIIATIQNTVDAHPQYQPMIITAQSGGTATIGWNVARDSGNYLINYYAISLTS